MSVISPGVILIGLLNLIGLVELVIIRRHYHDGILYDDYAADSDNVRYLNTKGEGWDDLDSLVKEHYLRKKAMFCTRGPGAWLLYQEASYQYGSVQQLKLVYGEHCVAADNVNSVQPLGAVYASIEDHSAVVTFSETYFASKGETSAEGASGSIKSTIFVGSGNWTMEVDGNKICIRVLSESDVCLLENIPTTFSTTGDSLSISKDCTSEGNDTMEQYLLQTCYSAGFHELTYEFDFTLPSIQGLCSSDAYDPEDPTKFKFLQVVNLWKKRMHPPGNEGIESTVQNAAQRINTLNTMVMIMEKTCSGVSPTFLEIVKQIYMVHIKNGLIWNVTETADGTKIEQSGAKWHRAQNFITECLNHNTIIPTGCTPEDISQMKNENEVAAIEDFLNGESYDFVIEHVWLLLNYVSTYCSYQQGFINNDWSIFPLLFKRDFLYPLQEQWKNPGKWSTYYTLMFNGINMEDERKAVIGCVQRVIKETPFYDPLARPPGFYYSVNTTDDKDNIGGVTPLPTDERPKREKELSEPDDDDDEPLSDEETLAFTETIGNSNFKLESTIATTAVQPTTTASATNVDVTPEITAEVGETGAEFEENTATTTEKAHKKKKKKNKDKHGKKSKGKHGKKHHRQHTKRVKSHVAEFMQPTPTEDTQTEQPAMQVEQ